MNNQQAVVDQIVQNLAFEVEAVPKNKSIQATSISQSTPLNVKIKVRKKDEIHKQHDVSSTADDAPRAVHKIRLVNSDRTIMTFDVFMEAEFEKKPSRNLRKHIFDMLRPGICLGAVDDDEYPNMPSSSYSANITEPSVTNKSDGTLKQTFTLSKNVYQDYTVATQPGGQKWLFGKCKPGGCLDPPFSEDKYSYKPSTRSGPERGQEELLEKEDVRSDICSNKIPIALHGEEVQSNGRHSSIFDSGLFKKKRKSSDKSTNTKLPDKTDSIVNIYQGESTTNSMSTHSNSIITYPPKVRSDPRICDDKTVRSRGPSEEKSRNSFNDHSEPYFIRPKGVNRIKEKETLDPSDYPKHRSSDATGLRNSLKESFKMPVPLAIPIPVPIPIMSNKQKPEVIATNDNILKTQGDSASVTGLDSISDQKPQDQESQDAINLKDTDMPTRRLLDTLATENTGDKPVESSKIATLIPSNVEKSITPNEIDDQNLQKIKLQTLKEIDSEKNIDDTPPPSKKTKTEPLKIPVPVPFILSETNRAAVLDPNMINDNLQRSKLKLTQSKQSFETKTTSPTIKDTPFEDSKDILQNIDPGNRSGKTETTATPISQYSDMEADAIPENYLRTRGTFSDPESDTENPVNIASKMEEHTKRDSKEEEITTDLEKPAKQNDIKDKATTSTAPATAVIATATAAAAIAAAVAATTTAAAKEEISEIYEMPDMDTQQNTGSPNKNETNDSHRISLSKLPISIRSISLLSGSKTSGASVKDKTKKSDSPDKNLDNVGHRDTDLGVHKDEKQTPLFSGPTSAASVKDKTKRSDSPDKHLGYIRHRDSDLGVQKDEKQTPLSSGPTSAASVKDTTKRSDSPDKYLDNVGHRDTDLGVHKDEKPTSLSSGPTSAASVKDTTKRSDSPDKHLGYIGHRDSELGVHQDEKRTSLFSGPTSAASVKDKTKKSDSPDKHLDSVGHRETDLRVHKDEKPTSLSSGRTSAASVKYTTKRSDSPDKHLDYIGHRDSDLGKDEKRTSLFSGPTSAASVKDKPKKSDSPDKHLDNVGHRDTDLGIHKGEKRTSLSSGPTSAASVKDTIRRSDSPDKHLDNVGHRDTDLGVHKGKKRTSLSSGLTSPTSVKETTKRSGSPDKHLDNVGHKVSDLSVHKGQKRTSLSSRPSSSALVKDQTKRSNSPDKHVGQRDTDLGIHKDEKRTSLSGGPTSAASVKETAKRSNSPDIYLDNMGYRETDLGGLKNDKQTSLSIGPKYDPDTWDAKISEPPRNKKYVSETEKPNNYDKIDSYTESQARYTDEGIMNFKAAPVIIDNTEPTPNLLPLIEVYSETNFVGEPINTGHELDPSDAPFTTQIVKRFRKFDEDDGTHSTVSRELVGTKSVIYDTEEYIPKTSAKINAERIISSDKRGILPIDTVIPSIQSTSTLKSAMKKDTMSVELGFHSYLNDKNERILRTFDAANAPKRLPNDSVTVLNSQIRISSNEIRIPVDSEHDMSIQIKKANANQRVSISESGFVNIIDNGRVKKQRSPVQCIDDGMRSTEVKTEVRKGNILESDATDDRFIDYYEQELLPLQLIIKNLRDEIDVLAAQQLIFKDKLFCANKSKLPRLVHSNKKCFGCVRK